jgi:hypothetical protein
LYQLIHQINRIGGLPSEDEHPERKWLAIGEDAIARV